MSFLRSRAEQLADYLRGSIARSELTEPLPGTRDWANQLNVGRKTLDQALRILVREGLLAVRAREGTRLCVTPGTRPAASPRSRLARILYYGEEYPDVSHLLAWFTALSARLQAHQIHVALEKCSPARLVEISRHCGSSGDLLLLLSLAPEQQRLFARHAAKVLILGARGEGVPLSSVNIDVVSAVRHATNTLLRRGFSSLALLDGIGTAPSMRQTATEFRRA